MTAFVRWKIDGALKVARSEVLEAENVTEPVVILGGVQGHRYPDVDIAGPHGGLIWLVSSA